MKDKKSLFKYGIIGVIVPIIIYTGLVFVSMGSSGSKTTADFVYPTVQLARNIVFFGTLIIRFDIFFIIFWILAVYTSLTIYMYMSTFSIVRLIGLRNYKPFALIIAPIIYLIALLPQNQIEIETFSKVANYTGLFITSSSIPILLIAVIRKKGGKANA
jgi:spore germination protein